MDWEVGSGAASYLFYLTLRDYEIAKRLLGPRVRERVKTRHPKQNTQNRTPKTNPSSLVLTSFLEGKIELLRGGCAC